ncbi:MAG: hypothetical protein IPM96_17885 [Ignavibacteria bacterium]|nr:hypothetical protein [Ignavibacteria bacterium]
MNILKICAILIFAVTTQSFSQVSEVWRKSYTQEIESRLIGFKIDNAGNMIAGSSVSRSGIGEFANFVIIKFNSSGDTLWRREYHSAGNKHDHLFDIYIDAAGNIYATGLSTGYQVSEVPTTRTIKYSPSGVLLWEAVDSSNSVMEVNGITKKDIFRKDQTEIFLSAQIIRESFI